MFYIWQNIGGITYGQVIPQIGHFLGLQCVHEPAVLSLQSPGSP
jgi:hypothetical protein